MLFIADGSVIMLNVSVLLRLAGLNMRNGNLAPFGPLFQRFTDIFRPIIDTYSDMLAAALNDPARASDDAVV